MAKLSDLLAPITTFRPFRPSDLKCVVNNWLKAFRDSPWAGCVSNDQYYEVHHEVLRQLFNRGAKVLVACEAADPDQILGWVCIEDVPGGAAVHFVYVKEGYRRKGLASELLERALEGKVGRRFYTFRTRASSYLFAGWQHAPEIVRRKKR